MKINKKYILLLVPALLFSGCKKYLEQPPDERTQLNSVEKVSELLVTAYPRANYITFTESMSDNAADKGTSGGEPVNRDPWFFQDVNSRDEDSPDFYWYACYKAIAAANHALEAISLAENPKDYDAQKGEALVARAYAHFMLVTLFSVVYNPSTATTDLGIPYVTEPEKVVVKKYSRKTVAFVYEQIEKDLTAGIPLIKDNVYTVPKYHFTKAAANAFAARFYLFKRDYQKVVDYANAVFAGTNIITNLRPINDPEYRALQYFALEAQYTASTTNANILLAETNSYWGRSYPGYRYGYSFDILYQTHFKSNVTGGQWAWQIYGQDKTLNIPKFREHFVKISTNADIGDGYNMVPLFSAEEVLFNRAEAYTYLGNTTAAIKDLNDYASTRVIISDNNPVYSPTLHEVTASKIRTFYSTNSLQNGLVKTILDFKRVEFMFEGMRWFDILRYNMTVVHTIASNGLPIVLSGGDLRRVLQLPKEAIRDGLEANPR
jgi:hypothetical protein